MNNNRLVRNSVQFKIEFAQSASGVGAFVLGAGVGILFFVQLAAAKYVLLIAGILIHGWGMYALAGMKNENGERMFYTNHWLRLLMWVCVVALIILAVILVQLAG